MKVATEDRLVENKVSFLIDEYVACFNTLSFNSYHKYFLLELLMCLLCWLPLM